MESNVQSEPQDQQEQQRQAEINREERGAIAPVKPSEPPSSDQPWREWIDPVIQFLAKLPDYVGNFFADYRQPLIVLLLILAAIITVNITLAVLDAINGFPLLASILELVGLGYSGWFIWRYLLRKSTRDELAEQFNSLRGEVLGEKQQSR